MTWRLGPVDQRTGGGRPPSTGALAVPWPSGKARLLTLLGVVAGALVLLGGPVPAASAADSFANAPVRTGFSSALPDCRAYELVTPADKDANSLVFHLVTGNGGYSDQQSNLRPSVSGDQFFTQEATSFADPHGANASQLVSVREAAGWQTVNIQPRTCRGSVYGLTERWQAARFLSMDFSAELFQSAVTPQGADLGCDPGDQAGKDVYRAGTDGSLAWVSQNGQPKTTDEDAVPEGISADGTHVLFTTSQKLVPQDAGRTTGSGLYDRAGGRTVAVGLKSDGTPVNACGATAPGNGSTPWRISRDNRVIFFLSGTNAATPGCTSADVGRLGQLYARIDASKTVELSASRLATPEAPGNVAFLGATPDGRKVYFSSSERLVGKATAGGGLYEYDLTDVLNGSASTGTLRFLSPSVDGNPATVDRLLRVVGDGQEVYFLARGVLVNGVASTGRKIYRSVGGQVQLVAQLESTAMAAGDLVDLGSTGVSPDGSKVIYVDQPAGEPYPQVYLVNGDGSGAPVCVSCSPAGTVASGPATLLNAVFAGAIRWFGMNAFVANDGRVVFGSPDRLAAGDRDDFYDVYEYRAGQRYLLTPGTDGSDTLLIGVGPKLRDVFVVTDSSLVGQDFDNGDMDVYDVRVGGGFPAPPTPKLPCAGDECQPQASPPTLAAPGSVAFVAPFAAPRATPATKPSAKKMSVKRPKTVHGATKVRLSVKAPEAGRIRVSGSGLKRAKKTAKKAKTYHVTVKLSKRSKRILKRKHRVKVRATVRFTPKHGKASRVRVHVTFKAKQHRRKATRRSQDRAHSAAGKGGR